MTFCFEQTGESSLLPLPPPPPPPSSLWLCAWYLATESKTPLFYLANKVSIGESECPTWDCSKYFIVRGFCRKNGFSVGNVPWHISSIDTTVMPLMTYSTLQTRISCSSILWSFRDNPAQVFWNLIIAEIYEFFVASNSLRLFRFHKT